MDSLEDLEEIRRVCYKAVQSLRKQIYEKDVNSLWDRFVKAYKRGDTIKYKSKATNKVLYNLRVYEIKSNPRLVVLKDTGEGVEFNLSPDSLYKYSLYELDFSLLEEDY